MKIAVVGAHLSGQPLNKQLTERGATLVKTTLTAPIYKFYALANTTPAKPGLVKGERVANGIEVEVWEMGAAEFGTFVDGVPAPMCIGTLDLADGEKVKGFLVEPYGIVGAEEITHLGGWRNYLKSRSA